jgi:cytochrome c5
LDSYTSIIRKGLSPGSANNSKIYEVLFATGEELMPPDGALTKAQKDSIAAWINQGAKNTVNCNCVCDPTAFTYAAIIQPILLNSCVGCHKASSLGGNIDLSSYANVIAQVANGKLVGSVTHTTGFSAMPKGGKLPDCQILQIKSWIAAGATNN